MKVLITGAHGQLGQDIARIFNLAGHEVISYGREELNITDLDQCLQVSSTRRPDWIIHCAAYTAVDAAETDMDGAYLVNAVGTRNMALAAEKSMPRSYLLARTTFLVVRVKGHITSMILPTRKAFMESPSLQGNRWFNIFALVGLLCELHGCSACMATTL